MSYRYMRVIVFFDLPSVTIVDKKEYLKFRKLLIKEGFIMMQESVYCKIALNNTVASLIKNKLRKLKPKEGLIQILTITEKQFASIEFLCGEAQKTVIDSEERLLIF